MLTEKQQQLVPDRDKLAAVVQNQFLPDTFIRLTGPDTSHLFDALLRNALWMKSLPWLRLNDFALVGKVLVWGDCSAVTSCEGSPM